MWEFSAGAADYFLPFSFPLSFLLKQPWLKLRLISGNAGWNASRLEVHRSFSRVRTARFPDDKSKTLR
jgi:hypothetical protein